ncbi:MAG: ABC transporter ATP-binding protein [Pseudomonadota bacterium]
MAESNATRADSDEIVLRARDLRVVFPHRHGDIVTLDGVGFDVRRGEILGMVGESGAGKSMTGAAIIGLIDSPGYLDRGEVELSGKRIDKLDARSSQNIRGRRISMVFQDPLTSLNPLRTIGDQLIETITTHLSVSRDEAKRKAIAGLEEVGIPANRFNAYPHEFSGGMRQRVVIALSLCAEPELIIADEPTTALDVSVQAQVLKLLRQLCQEHNTAVILITHDMGVIAETTDRVAVLYGGELLEIGDTQTVLENPQHPYTRGLIACTPSVEYGDITTRLAQIGDENVDQPPSGFENATPTSEINPSEENGNQTFIRIENLSRRFDLSDPWLARVMYRRSKQFLDAVDNVSFEIQRGTTYALVGESGSGKSTIARMAVGLLAPSTGQVLIDGHNLHDTNMTQSEHRKIRQRMQMVFQSPFASLNPRWRVGSILAEPLRVFELVDDNDAERARVTELLEQVGLSASDAKRFPHEFSGGQRQRISIARSLASKPDFIVCDEPTSALDVSVQAQVLNLLKELQQELGLTYLFITHDLAVVRVMAHNIGVLKSGKLVEEQATEALIESPQSDYTQMLIRSAPRIRRKEPLT